MQSTGSQIHCMYHNHTQFQCLGSSFTKLSVRTKMSAFLIIYSWGTIRSAEDAALNVFAYYRTWVCLNSDKISKIKVILAQMRRVSMLWINVWLYSTLALHKFCGWAYIASSSNTWCKTAHCFEMEKAIWHWTHAVLPCTWIFLYAVKKIHTIAYCAPTSPVREV